MTTFIPKLYIYRWFKHEISKYLQIVQRDAHNSGVLFVCLGQGEVLDSVGFCLVGFGGFVCCYFLVWGFLFVCFGLVWVLGGGHSKDHRFSSRFLPAN